MWLLYMHVYISYVCWNESGFLLVGKMKDANKDSLVVLWPTNWPRKESSL